MTVRTSVFSLLLLATDSDLQMQFKHDLQEASVTVVKDWASLQRAAARRTYDGVIVETKRGQSHELAEVQRLINPHRTFLVTGSRSVLRHAPGILRSWVNGNGHPQAGVDLEGYIESKLGGFVKEMKNGTARNLHPMLVKAVERPLIARVLSETNGNQIQAAHVLGMNRNTLRKKIKELRITVSRGKARQA
ncbi:MAG: helix-turn-helix domain-containing protein [Nitrospirota bacterium]